MAPDVHGRATNHKGVPPVRLTPLAIATSVLVFTAAARAQDPAPAPEQPPAPAPQTPAPAPAPLGPEERIRALEERLAAVEKAQPEVPALEGRVGALEATLRNVVLAVADQVKVTGLVSGSYTWNLADPPGRRGTNLLRVSDPDHDTFAVTYAKLGLYRDLSGGNEWDAGFRAELAAGRLVEQTLSLDPDFNGGDEVNLANAYVQLQAPTPLGRPLTITAGRFYGWFGVESLDVPTNPNFSLSVFSNFTPFTNTGVGVGLELVEGLKYTQYVVNGWDLVFDANDSKSYGGQLAFTLDDPATTIALNWLVGAEQASDEEDLRWLVELDLTTKLTETTDLRAALHYGQEEGAAQPGRAGGAVRGVAKYGGAMLIVRQELYEVREGFRRFAIGARTSFWRDEGGSKSGLSQTLVDVTGTFEVRFTEHASLRVEWRHDQSNRAFYLGGRGLPSQHHQDTAAVELNFRF